MYKYIFYHICKKKLILKFKFNLNQNYQINVTTGIWKAILLSTVFLSMNFLLHLNSGIVFSIITKATGKKSSIFIEKNEVNVAN